MNTPFKFVSFFNEVDKLLEVDCLFWTCAVLVTPEKLASSSHWKFVYHLPEGILKPLPSNFSWISVIKYSLDNIFGPRHLIPRNSEALFVDSMPPKVTIPTPSTEEIERCHLKVLERKRKQAKDRARRKAEKKARPKRKARATKGTGPEPSDTGFQERLLSQARNVSLNFPILSLIKLQKH